MADTQTAVVLRGLEKKIAGTLERFCTERYSSEVYGEVKETIKNYAMLVGSMAANSERRAALATRPRVAAEQDSPDQTAE
jgi:hypothetical protein